MTAKEILPALGWRIVEATKVAGLISFRDIPVAGASLKMTEPSCSRHQTTSKRLLSALSLIIAA